MPEPAGPATFAARAIGRLAVVVAVSVLLVGATWATLHLGRHVLWGAYGLVLVVWGIQAFRLPHLDLRRQAAAAVTAVGVLLFVVGTLGEGLVCVETAAESVSSGVVYDLGANRLTFGSLARAGQRCAATPSPASRASAWNSPVWRCWPTWNSARRGGDPGQPTRQCRETTERLSAPGRLLFSTPRFSRRPRRLADGAGRLARGKMYVQHPMSLYQMIRRGGEGR